jgi:glutamine synthetase
MEEKLLKSIWILCLKAGLNIEGINAEVAAGQWEFQIFR